MITKIRVRGEISDAGRQSSPESAPAAVVRGGKGAVMVRDQRRGGVEPVAHARRWQGERQGQIVRRAGGSIEGSTAAPAALRGHFHASQWPGAGRGTASKAGSVFRRQAQLH
jgi:glycerate-2-kinase